MIKNALLNLVFFFAMSFSQLVCDCYSEYWQQLYWTMWENKQFEIGTYIKVNTGDHFQNIRYYQLNEQFIWKACKGFYLELHYAYIHGRSVVPNSLWSWQHRIELEGNRSFKLGCHYQLETRNRLEIRRIENDTGLNYRFRQRTMLILPLEDSIIESISAFNEIFYNFTTGTFTQDRVCPCRLRFKIADNVKLNVFFLVRFFRHNTNWENSAVLGSQLSF